MSSRTVVVVEDRADTAKSMCLLVSALGHTCLAAFNGSMALEVAFRAKPDIIILDIGLPDLDGFEVARRLRLDPQFAKIQIIALTGHASEEFRERAVEAGIDLYLLKPVDPSFLESLLGTSARNTLASMRSASESKS
jgi:CheY-like chemotaxis protein